MSRISSSKDGREEWRAEDEQEQSSGGGGMCGTAREVWRASDEKSQAIQVRIKNKGRGPF